VFSCAVKFDADIEKVDVGETSAEMLETVGLTTVRPIVKLGMMDMKPDGKRTDILESERMEVVRVPSTNPSTQTFLMNSSNAAMYHCHDT
jgi:hypothetical protein